MSWRLASFSPTYQSVGSIRSIFTAAFIVKVVPNNKAVSIFFIVYFVLSSFFLDFLEGLDFLGITRISSFLSKKDQGFLGRDLHLIALVLSDSCEVYLSSLAH